MNVQLNEIRLGNWFHHNVSVWTSRNDDGVISNHGEFAEDCFQWEESDWYGLSECTMFIETIEPIPLSEEWIKRSYVKKRNGYPYEFLNGYIVLCDGKYYFKYHDIFICVDYVHQLQNLFFVFRGEELVFSTEP